MCRRIYISLVFLAAIWIFSGTAFAASDLPSVLAGDTITIGNYDLAKDDLKNFYAARNYKPVWNFAGPENAKAFEAFLASINDVIDYHGLRRDEYPLDLMRSLASSADDNDRLKLELLVTDTLLLLAHELHGDLNELEDIYVGWTLHRTEIDIPALLAAAVANNGLSTFISDLEPHNPAYLQLTKALKTYREMATNGGWPKIDPGPTLRPNDHGPRIAQLRARLIAESYLPAQTTAAPVNTEMFDADLHQALTRWQENNGLDSDGNMGGKTLDALNVPVEDKINQIRANMERWRHMPEDFPPDRYVLINIANASIDITEDGKDIFRGPVIVGRVDRKTPFIESVVRSMIINPSWHVPTKIARKDILPKLRKDPHYLEKLGFVIRGNTDDPYGENIDWDSMKEREFNFRLRQSPGDMNSLGRLKFDFDNDFAVYMHGTPHQELFKKSQRNFSSGCVRLRDPEQVAEILLAANTGEWNVQKIDDAVNSNQTHWMALAKPIPIYILYWTVFADEAGNLNFRKDVYNYDGMLTSPQTIGTTAQPGNPAP